MYSLLWPLSYGLILFLLQGLRRDHPAAPLTEALQLCRDEAVESDRTKRTLAR